MVRVQCTEVASLELRFNKLTCGKIYPVLEDCGGTWLIQVDDGSKRRVVKSRFKVLSNSLQDVLAKAKELYDKGLINTYGEFKNHEKVGVVSVLETCGGTFKNFKDTVEDVEEGLKYLQSLEVETFKIETVYDLDKIVLSRKPKVTLLNGFECLLREAVHNTDRGMLFDVTNLHTNRYSRLDYTSLKGATITQ